MATVMHDKCSGMFPQWQCNDHDVLNAKTNLKRTSREKKKVAFNQRVACI